jgi:hypothetical protein
MDWQAAEDGLKAWVVAMTMIAPELVAWDSQPVGMRLYPQVDLRLFDHRGRDGMGAEITYGEPNDVGQMYPVASQQRVCSWSITVTTRDQRANQKAYVVLDEVAVMLELPYTTERLGTLGLALLDMGRVIPNVDVPSEHRELSQAVLTLQLGYVTEVTVPPAVSGAAVDIIEHTEIGGTVLDADVTTPVGVETKIIPPLA